MNDFSEYILSVMAFFGRMIYGNFFTFIDHFKSFDVHIVNASVRKRSGNTWKVKSYKKFEPAVFSLFGGGALSNQNFFIHSSLLNHIGDCFPLNADCNSPVLKVVKNIFFSDHVAGNPGNVCVSLVSVVFDRNIKFFFTQGIEACFQTVCFRSICRLGICKKFFPHLLHVGAGIN